MHNDFLLGLMNENKGFGFEVLDVRRKYMNWKKRELTTFAGNFREKKPILIYIIYGAQCIR